MLGSVAAFLEFDWTGAEKLLRMALAHEPVSPMVRLTYAVCYLLVTGRPDEAVQQIERGLQDDPLNALMQFYRALSLAAAGRDEEAAERFREILEFHPSTAPAYFSLAVQHLLRGALDQAVAFAEKGYPIAPMVPNSIGLLAGLLMLTGIKPRSGELLQKLQPADAFGIPRGLAIYHWVLREFDAEADWLEKALDQRDPAAMLMLRLWYGRELRSTPRWATLMRKINLS
jgi:tetratricopeptide (TPR) repeat protein